MARCHCRHRAECVPTARYVYIRSTVMTMSMSMFISLPGLCCRWQSRPKKHGQSQKVRTSAFRQRLRRRRLRRASRRIIMHAFLTGWHLLESRQPELIYISGAYETTSTDVDDENDDAWYKVHVNAVGVNGISSIQVLAKRGREFRCFSCVPFVTASLCWLDYFIYFFLSIFVFVLFSSLE